MGIYSFPLNPTTPVTIAAGADFATETTLLLVESAVDGLETAVAATNTKLDTVITHVDGLETALAAINTLITDKVGGSLVNVKYDNFEVDVSGATTDVYTYKVGVATVKTVTITYADATKQVITTTAAV